MNFDQIAELAKVSGKQVANVVSLLEGGATIPFIARYRKERTGNLDELTIQHISDLWEQMVELDKRRKFILSQIEEQGKLTEDLRQSILHCHDTNALEDLYLPYKLRKQTRADKAREAGFEPLARAIYDQKGDKWLYDWKNLVRDRTMDLEMCLPFARDIMAEWINENTIVRGNMRDMLLQKGILECKAARGKGEKEEAQKYKDYFDYSEKAGKVPSHRYLAMRRGKEEGWLKLSVVLSQKEVELHLKKLCLRGYGKSQQQIIIAMMDAWKRLLQPSLESELLADLKDKADDSAIRVFAENVRQLLFAPPLGEKAVLAIDPGFKTGCKIVALNNQGDLLEYQTIFPHEPIGQKQEAQKIVNEFVAKHAIKVIAIGNGTAGRETETWILTFSGLPVYMVNESGASIYSASQIAREEFPNLDLTYRGAISIGRRLMDPLSELVKIDPKSIGVGQYQHDVNQTLLKKRLDALIVSTVSAVGVNINTASSYLLSYVSGLGPALAKNIFLYRQKYGKFKSREELKKVERLGDKAFEQSAGFLRIRDGINPLDNTGVHPERYGVVQKMAMGQGLSVADFVSQPEKIKEVDKPKYFNELLGIGLPTIQSIEQELLKPGLDPRGEFVNIDFNAAIRSISDLDSGMELNGIVTNIVDFGAFIDIGVKQDGLVHISQISEQFIKHPSEKVQLGQHVKVRVTEIDVPRKRIGLTMKF